jgi:S-DNA-T family DNA segregation ATPase FtsK/SpoIIIE
LARKRTGRRIRRKKEIISNTIKNEILGIVILGVACLGFVLLYANNGSAAAKLVVRMLRTGMGDGSAGLFIVLAFFGLNLMSNDKRTRKSRMAGVILLWFTFVGFNHMGLDNYESAQLLALGKAGLGGGLLGAAESILLINLVGVTGAYVVLVVLAVIGAILTINRSLVETLTDIFTVLARGIASVGTQLGDFHKVLAAGEKEKKLKTEPSPEGTFAKKREPVRNLPEYFFDSQPADLIIDLPGEEVERKTEEPKPGWDKTVPAKSNQEPAAKETKPAPGKLTGTPLSRKNEKNDHYQLPPVNLLHKMNKRGNKANKDLAENVKLLEDTLASFGVKVKVTRVTQGPTITRYEIQPAPGVKVSKITSLADDIALSLAARDVRIEAPIPGKSAVGIEVPNKEISIVHFRDVLETEEYQNMPGKLSLALGQDIAGFPIIADLTKMPHLLIAGATGSGKSVCINTIIASIVFKAKPDEVKLLLIDPKMVELANYNGIPHLISPVVTEAQKAASALKWIVTEMETRYELFAAAGVRDIVRYNFIVGEKKEEQKEEKKAPEELKVLPYVVVIIDELADLMMVAPGEVEEAICRLAQMARAAGIHLIVATQRPSVDVITGLIKANIPSRIAFAVSSQIDSRTILDMNGAEKLLGQGDMLYHPIGMSKPVRMQGSFLADKEVKNIVDFLIEQAKPEYCEIPETSLQSTKSEEPEDELFYKAANVFFENNTASVSLLQRRLRIGYTRAARLMDLLEEKGVVGQYEGSKPRELLLTKGQFDLKFGEKDEA